MLLIIVFLEIICHPNVLRANVFLRTGCIVPLNPVSCNTGLQQDALNIATILYTGNTQPTDITT